MFDSIAPVESEPTSVVSSHWLWAARCFALIYTIALVGEYVTAALANPVLALFMFLFMFGVRGLLSLVLLYFLFRRGKKSLALALGLGAATAFIALFGVASNALFWPLGQSFGLASMVIFGPTTPPFVGMMHAPNPELATAGLLLFWSFGICSAMLGLSSVVAFKKTAHEAEGTGKLRLAFCAGIAVPFVVWLIGMLLVMTVLPFHI